MEGSLMRLENILNRKIRGIVYRRIKLESEDLVGPTISSRKILNLKSIKYFYR